MKQDKPDDNFHWKLKSQGKRHSWCKPCKQDYESKYYHKGPNRKQQLAAQREKTTARNRAIVAGYKKHGCTDCGEADPIVLEFDHLRDKNFNIASAMERNVKVLIKEIEKCEVVCANCHRRRTYSRLASGAR